MNQRRVPYRFIYTDNGHFSPDVPAESVLEELAEAAYNVIAVGVPAWAIAEGAVKLERWQCVFDADWPLTPTCDPNRDFVHNPHEKCGWVDATGRRLPVGAGQKE